MYNYKQIIAKFVEDGIDYAPVLFDKISDRVGTHELTQDVISGLVLAIDELDAADEVCVALSIKSFLIWLIRTPKVKLPLQNAFVLQLDPDGFTALRDFWNVRTI